MMNSAPLSSQNTAVVAETPSVSATAETALGEPQDVRRAVARSRRRRRLRAWLPTLILFFGVGALGAFQERQTGGDVTWASSYDAGMAQAKRSHQPVVLSFRMPGCGWCAKMDVETYTDPQVVALTRRFACIRVESDLDPQLIARYRVSAFPATILLDTNGQVVSRLTGYQPASDLLPALRAALSPESEPQKP